MNFSFCSAAVEQCFIKSFRLLTLVDGASGKYPPHWRHKKKEKKDKELASSIRYIALCYKNTFRSSGSGLSNGSTKVIKIPDSLFTIPISFFVILLYIFDRTLSTGKCHNDPVKKLYIFDKKQHLDETGNGCKTEQDEFPAVMQGNANKKSAETCIWIRFNI